MRWLGILFLFCTCTGIGMYAARQLGTRHAHTRQLASLLEDFSTRIRSQCLPLEDLFSLYAEHPNYKDFTFLRRISREFCTELPPATLWKDAVSDDAAIEIRAKEILYAVGNVLGTTDMQGQLDALELYGQQMRELAAEMYENNRKKGELYRRLGVLTGAMLAVLII